jgi:hypothetical protein
MAAAIAKLKASQAKPCYVARLGSALLKIAKPLEAKLQLSQAKLWQHYCTNTSAYI